ncbi:helix-hairpin-helix domain-containing protein [Brachybacterium paraconglomeratum]|uniref:helix-hairpin-helix domain-containing protein n=1 Tax=Brachybacterium paraconglomeratum TaxID=173362 RepID=UPI003FD42E49
MGAPPGIEERGTAARHRRTGEPLIRRRDHSAERPRRRLPFPAPPASALIGIAVLVLIGAGVIHLSGTGSAIPQEEPAGVTVAEGEAAGPEGGADGAGSDGAEGADDDGDLEGGDGPGDSAQAPGEGAGAGRAGGGAESSGDPAAPASSAPTELVVHVSGAVTSPGVVRLPPGARVDDALHAAGGATGDAELAAVNLARPVVDGEQIHVPVPGEEPPAVAAPAPAADAPPAGDAGAGDGAAGGGGADGGLIDLNTASVAELDELPGVGPAIAQRIVDHREQNGRFESVDQLEEVSGIGPATLEKMRDRATV